MDILSETEAWGKRKLIGVLLAIAMIGMTGCVTELGYVPAYPKLTESTSSDTSNLTTRYVETKQWAKEVMDGYDTRATFNRYSLYWGALVGAAAGGAIAGLAAYDSGNSALIGIPIGTAFLGSVAAIFQSEEKARIYGLASMYTHDLLILSDERLAHRKLAASDPQKLVDLASKSEDASKKQLDEAFALYEEKERQAVAARAKATAETDATKKKVFAELADAVEKIVVRSKESVADREKRHERLVRLHADSLYRKSAGDELQAARQEFEEAERIENANRGPAVATARVALAAKQEKWERLNQHEQEEAFCIRHDVSDVIRRVNEHVALLDPKNLADKLRAIKNSQSKEMGEGPSTSLPADSPKDLDAVVSKLTDLANLQPPVKSRCDDPLVKP